MNGSNDALLERQKYLNAYNSTMVKIWKEKIAMLGVVDTGNLYRSVVSLPLSADGKFLSAKITHNYALYGLYQARGTGKEVYRGNPGDIGRPKVRERRDWFSKKYYASMMNLREFMADNLGRDFGGMCSRLFDGKGKIV